MSGLSFRYLGLSKGAVQIRLNLLTRELHVLEEDHLSHGEKDGGEQSFETKKPAKKSQTSQSQHGLHAFFSGSSYFEPVTLTETLKANNGGTNEMKGDTKTGTMGSAILQVESVLPVKCDIEASERKIASTGTLQRPGDGASAFPPVSTMPIDKSMEVQGSESSDNHGSGQKRKNPPTTQEGTSDEGNELGKKARQSSA